MTVQEEQSGDVLLGGEVPPDPDVVDVPALPFEFAA
jgi:hypothetical protein